MKRLLFASLAVVLLGSTISKMHGQATSAFADTKLYDAVLEVLFQHEIQPRSPEIQLRYTYCNAGEMQVVVQQALDDGFKLDVWYVPLGTPDIWDQLAKLTGTAPDISVDAAAKLIKLSRKEIQVPRSTALGKLLDAASSLSMPLLIPSTITVDGMAYGLATRSIAEDMSLTMQGPPEAENSDNQLIRWMGSIRADVEVQLRAH